MVHSYSYQHLHSTTHVSSPCLLLKSSAQTAKQTPDPTSVTLPPQLLVGFVPALQPVSVLFLLSLHLAFLLLPSSASLLVLSSTPILPSTSTLPPAASVLLRTTYDFLSSSTMLSIFFSFVSKVSLMSIGPAFILQLCSHFGLAKILLFPLSCMGLLPFVVVSF